ncbi:hypothetical protein ABZV78_14605 [Micromonospora sp. NPDC004540]|uniref:hypothetical protein n=1 Tax=Micromonospora sp. NPDC004540 TaxID=3154457 RepID=UPI0033A1E9BA
MQWKIRPVAVLAEQVSGAFGGDDGVHRVAGPVDHVVVLAQQFVGDRPAVAGLHGQPGQPVVVCRPSSGTRS